MHACMYVINLLLIWLILNILYIVLFHSIPFHIPFHTVSHDRMPLTTHHCQGNFTSKNLFNIFMVSIIFIVTINYSHINIDPLFLLFLYLSKYLGLSSKSLLSWWLANKNRLSTLEFLDTSYLNYFP